MAESLTHNPLYVMAKPAGPACNLACKYCYYLEKKDLFTESRRTHMDDRTLATFIRQYIEAQAERDVMFTWHGGEALLRPIDFYRKVLDLQQKYAGTHRIANSLQTNGTLLTPEWCQFLRQNGWLVGISIDGPQDFHDEYRRNVGNKPSFLQVMRGIKMLQQYGVEWNAMAVVNDYNADYPEEFYHFFKDIGCKYLQFTPIVERINTNGALASSGQSGEMAPFSVTPEQWGRFACGVFDEWIKEDVGEVFVQLFDATLANWVGVAPGLCTMAPTCGHAGVIEHNGDVYSCDHFVFPEYYLGNIHQSSILEMMTSDSQLQFGQDKYNKLPDQCLKCKYLFACNGECPKNRFAKTADGQPGLNYLCEGYRKYFAHVAPYMDYMAQQLKAELPPSNVMEWARQQKGLK